MLEKRAGINEQQRNFYLTHHKVHFSKENTQMLMCTSKS